MGKIKTLELTEAQRTALEKGYRMGESHCFRMRCQIILRGMRAAHLSRDRSNSGLL